MNTVSPPPIFQSKFSSETITNIYYWTENLLSLRTTRPINYQFIPGQFARLGIKVDTEILWRAYSLVSSNQEEELEYFLVLVHDGLFTKQLKKLKLGSTILVEKYSHGFMTSDRFIDGEDLWMMATGTGLGPFISILQDPKVWKQFKNLVLVHCTRYRNELVYKKLLSSLPLRKNLAVGGAKMHMIQSTTRDQKIPEEEILQGRITSLLMNGDLEKAVGLDITVDKSRTMLCGNPEMITTTRNILSQRGFRPCRRAVPGQFVTEDYW